MGFHELMLIVRPLPKKDVFTCLKRIAKLIWDQQGVVKKIDYLGYRQLPWRKKSEEYGNITDGSYFLMHCSLGASRGHLLVPELTLDTDLVRFRMSPKDENILPENYACTLEQELQIPAKRESIQPLIKYRNVRTERRL